jgi:hypothetical protein
MWETALGAPARWLFCPVETAYFRVTYLWVEFGDHCANLAPRDAHTEKDTIDQERWPASGR